MSLELVLPVPNPDDLLTVAAYGAGALLRLERATTQGGTYTEIATVPIVAATYSYLTWDATGDTSKWYRWRYSNAGNTVQSDYGDPFPGGNQNYTSLQRLKVRAGIADTDTTSDDQLASFVDTANQLLYERIGGFIGPSSDTTRTYDGGRIPMRRLYIPGGIRTCTQLQASYPGSALSTVTGTDYRLGPRSSTMPPGEPYRYIEFLDYITGSYATFPYGQDNISITGTFGWAAVPETLAEIATSLALQYYNWRRAGHQVIAAEETGDLVWTRMLSMDDYNTVQRYAQEFRSFTT